LNILGLDLGTHTGYAYNKNEQFFCGTWELATKKEITAWGHDRQRRTKDPRIERLCENLTALGAFDIVAIEDVEFASSTYQVQLWSSLRGAVWLCALGSHFDCIPVGTLKKFATGNGAATKEAMAKALWKTQPMPGSENLDDNGVDAVWIWLWANNRLGRMK